MTAQQLRKRGSGISHRFRLVVQQQCGQASATNLQRSPGAILHNLCFIHHCPEQNDPLFLQCHTPGPLQKRGLRRVIGAFQAKTIAGHAARQRRFPLQKRREHKAATAVKLHNRFHYATRTFCPTVM